MNFSLYRLKTLHDHEISDSATRRGGSSVTPLLADHAVSSSPPLERPAGNATPAHAAPAPTPRSVPRLRRGAPRLRRGAALRAAMATRTARDPPKPPNRVAVKSENHY